MSGGRLCRIGRPLRTLLGTAIAVASAIVSSALPSLPSRPPQRIVFGGDVATPPYEYRDAEGRPQGFNVELIRAIGREAGVEIEVRLMPWADLLAEFDRGRIDVVGLGYSEARSRRYDFIAETWTLHQVIAFPPGRASYPASVRQMSDRVVALMEGGKIQDLFEEMPASERPRLLLVPNVADAVDALFRGEADAVGGNVFTLRYALAERGITDLVEVPAHSVPYLLAVRKGRGGEFAWVAAALARLKEKGAFASLVERLLTLPPPPLTWRDYLRPLAVLLGILGLVAGAIVAWSRSLRRQVTSRTAELAALVVEKDQLTQAMRESEARYRQLVESIHAIVWKADASMRRFVFVSKEAEALLGYPVESWTEPDFWSRHLHPDDREAARAATAGVVRERLPRELECRMRGKDGRFVWFRSLVHVVEDGGHAPDLVGVLVDVTGQKKLEEDLRQSQKMEAVGRLAGGVAHDFNNILTAILGYAQIVLQRLPNGDPLRPKAEGIMKAADRAAALTGQLLAFSRKQVLAPRTVDLNTVVRGIEGLLQRVIGEDVRLVCSLDRGLGAVKADPGQLEQVILNLAVNARDAMPRGGTLTLETVNVDLAPGSNGTSPACEGAHVLLAVKDTGVGMSVEVRSHIFEPFFTTKAPGKGTGLGLATVYGIVEQSGGAIGVESAPGEGAIFRIYLPRVDARPPALDRPTAVPKTARGSETVLLVEDEDGVRDLVGELLRGNGYNVLDARNAGEALIIAERHAGPIHLILTDVVMPHMSGRELAERLAPMRPEARVLFVSGYTDDAVLRHGVLQDQVQFLSKPFTADELTRKVRETLGAGTG